MTGKNRIGEPLDPADLETVRRMRWSVFSTGAIAVPMIERLCQLKAPPRIVVTANRANNPVCGLVRRYGLTALDSSDSSSAHIEQAVQSPCDLAVTFSHGQRIRAEFLDRPGLGFVNVHPSALPRWRGASPVAYTILQGDSHTAVTLIRMTSRFDHGPILAQHPVVVPQEATARTLSERLAQVVAQQMPSWLAALCRSALTPRPQQQEGMTRAPRLSRADGVVDLHKVGAEQIVRMVRALSPWPGVVLTCLGEELKIHEAVSFLPSDRSSLPSASGPIGEIGDRHLSVRTVQGFVSLRRVQRPNRAIIDGQAYMNGMRLRPGDVLGPQPQRRSRTSA